MTITDVPPQQPLVAFRGDTFRKPMDFVLAQGNAADCEIALTIKRFSSDTDADALVRLHTGDTTQGSITITGPLSVEFVIDEAVMATLPAKTLRYDVQVVMPSGEVRTAAWGPITIMADVTLATT